MKYFNFPIMTDVDEKSSFNVGFDNKYIGTALIRNRVVNHHLLI